MMKTSSAGQIYLVFVIFRAIVSLCLLITMADIAFSQSWQKIAPILLARQRPSCSVLPDGKILVIGGELNDVAISECEIYDPVTDSWSVTGNLHTPRFWFSSAILPNGNVFVAGGNTAENRGTTKTCEIYDYSKGSWRYTANMTRARSSFNANLLPNGHVLILGGIDSTSADFSSLSEEFDPATEIFSSIPPPQQSFYGYQSLYSRRLNGVVATGGFFVYTFHPNSLALVQLFDFATSSWKTLNPLPAPVIGCSQLVETDEGDIALLSGRSSYLNTTNRVQIFKPSSGVWGISGSISYGTDYGSSFLITGDSILTVGGNSILGSTPLPTSWIDIRSGQVWPGPIPIEARTSQTAAMEAVEDPGGCSVTKTIYIFTGWDMNLQAPMTECEKLVFPSIPNHVNTIFEGVGRVNHARPGDTIEAPLSLISNVPNAASCQLDLDYDTAILQQLDPVQEGSLIASIPGIHPITQTGGSTLSIPSSVALNNVGPLVKLRFRVRPVSPTGDTNRAQVSVRQLSLGAGITCLNLASDTAHISITYACGDPTLRQFMQTGKLIAMKPPFPNPLSSSTTLQYELDQQCAVTITLYDALGRIVARPVVGEMESSGTHEVSFETKELPSGLYSCRLSAGGEEMFAKMVVAGRR